MNSDLGSPASRPPGRLGLPFHPLPDGGSAPADRRLFGDRQETPLTPLVQLIDRLLCRSDGDRRQALEHLAEGTRLVDPGDGLVEQLARVRGSGVGVRESPRRRVIRHRRQQLLGRLVRLVADRSRLGVLLHDARRHLLHVSHAFARWRHRHNHPEGPLQLCREPADGVYLLTRGVYLRGLGLGRAIAHIFKSEGLTMSDPTAIN